MKEIITDEILLSERSEEIDVRKENVLMREIIIELKEVCRLHNALGVAAPQIGYQKRLFVINFNGDIRTFINPIVIKVEGFGLSREACLSVPGKEFIRPRHNQITVAYQTPLGKMETRKLVGKAAEVFQHELDHLDGLLISDIGLEIDENYDKASENEKAELIKAYLDSLDLKQKEITTEIENTPELKEMSDGIKFMEAVSSGEVEFKGTETIIKEAEEE